MLLKATESPGKGKSPTGLRATKAAQDSEPVTTEMIKTLLEDFP